MIALCILDEGRYIHNIYIDYIVGTSRSQVSLQPTLSFASFFAFSPLHQGRLVNEPPNP